MTDFDPETPRKKSKRRTRIDPEEAIGRKTESSLVDRVFASRIWKLAVTWSIVTILLVQIVKLFASDYAFFENPGPILAISFIIAWFFQNPPKAVPTWLIQPGSALVSGIFKRIWGLVSMLWSFGILAFLVLLVGKCSANPNAPFGVIVSVTLDEFFTAIRDVVSRVL